MSPDRRVRLWHLVVEQSDGGPVTVGHVCAAAMIATGTDGAAIAVALAATPRETIFSSSQLASQLEELSLTLGEGPCVDALFGGPSLIPDLGDASCTSRWPVFAPDAVHAGVRAIFALPLQIGAIRLGVLALCRTEPGELDHEQLLAALLLADTACAVLLDTTGPGVPATPGRIPEPAGLQHPEVHQATGMVSVQLGLSAALALIRIRAYAYAHERRLRDVARDVVARRLRFDPGGDPQGEQ
ncbi:GAF and ANTAR domain-containing protein [Dactylosporangium roseum]|uniref:GAF and ANTAR domain-containing protein n=1 Tax=Dactylosporangium roseum TaxID=47989 RepID=A0ABY5ZCR8_9ACTN|nr:GAF and ANTAR domain-containing protein [Dactylosporangium roseum]UWZ39662.1 GAF and ANTAR domain-containing protein [Dactylosporangium roseum]